MPNIIRRSHGLQLDHIGLGVGDTREGVKWVEEHTGATVELHDPEPDQWYWSGSLSIGEVSYLEIIGPNPEWTKFQPFNALLKSLKEPQLLFWFIAVMDFKKFQATARENKVKLQQIEAINIDARDDKNASYWRGVIGPGFMTERPNVIEWVRRPQRETNTPAQCRLKGFRLANPDADQINSVFQSLGIELSAANGPSKIGITLETPRGDWVIENAGLKWTMPGMLLELASLWWKTRNFPTV